MLSDVYRVFDCPHNVGTVLKISGSYQPQLGLCQVRAYSWNYQATLNVSLSVDSTGIGCNDSNVPSSNMFTLACRLEAAKTTNNQVFIRIDLGLSKYIRAVTIIGPDKATYMSKGAQWILAVGEKREEYTQNQEISRNQGADDNYGKEIIVGMKARYIVVYRTDQQTLGLRWIGVFIPTSTTEGCDAQPSFEWNYSSVQDPVILKVQNTPSQSTLNVFPTMGACKIAKVATHKNQSPLSNSFAYDFKTGDLTITVNSSSQLGVFELWVTAYVGDGITPNQSEAKLIQTYNICCDVTSEASTAKCGTALKVISQSPTSTISSPNEKIGAMLNLCTVSNGLKYTILSTNGDPNKSFVNGDDLVLNQPLSTQATVYETFITFEVAQGNKKTIAILDLVITDCQPHVLLQRADDGPLGKNDSGQYTATVTQYSALDLIWSTSPAVHEKCGKYYIKYTTPVGMKLYTYGDRIRLIPQTAGAQQFNFQLVRSDAEEEKESASLILNVLQCTPTSINVRVSTNTDNTNFNSIMTYTIGKDLEMFFHLSSSQYPFCNSPIEYSIVPTLPFLKVVTIGTEKRLRVSTSDTSLASTYTVNLNAQAGLLSASAQVTINFVTECLVRSVTPPSVTNLQTDQGDQILNFSVITTSSCTNSSQVVVIYTFQGRTSPTWFSKNGTDDKQVLIAPLSTNNDVGTYTITAEAYISSQTSAHVTCSWTFNVVSPTPDCSVVKILVCPAVTQVVKYRMQEAWSFNVIGSTPLSGLDTYVFTIKLDGTFKMSPTWFSNKDSVMTIEQKYLQTTDFGTYFIDVQRSSASTGKLCESCSIQLQVVDPCNTVLLIVPARLTMKLTFPAVDDKTINFDVTNDAGIECSILNGINGQVASLLTLSGRGTNFSITVPKSVLNGRGLSAIGTYTSIVWFQLVGSPMSPINEIPLAITVTGDCKAVNFQATSNLTMNLKVPATAEQRQIFQVTNEAGLECWPNFNFVGQTPSFLTINGTGSNFEVTASKDGLNAAMSSVVGQSYNPVVQYSVVGGQVSTIPLSITVSLETFTWTKSSTLRPLEEMELNLNDPIPQVLALPTYSTYPPLPAQMTISKQLVWLDSPLGFIQSLPSVITQDSEKIYVRINDLTSKGSYNLQVIAKVNDFPTVQNSDIQFTLKLSCTIKRLFMVESKVTDKVLQIPTGSSAVVETMQIPTYAADPKFCLSASGITVDIQPREKFISLVDGLIKIETAGTAFVGNYTFTLTATVPDSKIADSSVSFKVQIMKCYITKLSSVITAETRVDFTYQLRSARESFFMPSYSWEPSNCNKTLSYQLQNATPGSDATKLPTFISFDDKTRQVTLNGDSSSFADSGKQFTFKLVVTESESKLVDSSYQFKITTTFRNTAPQFKAALSSQTLKIGQNLTWSLPEVYDPDGDQIAQFVVKLGSKTWLQYSELTKSFTADPKALKEDAGTYLVEIFLSDQFKAESKYTQVVVLQKPDVSTNSTSTDSSSAAQNTTQITQPDNKAALNDNKAALNETNTETKSTSSNFVVPAFNPTSWIPPKQQAKKEQFLPPLRLMITQMNDDGTLMLSFNRKVEVNPLLLQQITMTVEGKDRRLAQSQQELDQIKLLLKESFQVRYTPMSEIQQAVLIDYTVVEFKDLLDITIQLNFDQPLLVSASSSNNNQMDRVVVSFNNNNIFLDPTTMLALPKDIFNKEVITIPRQQASSVQANTIKQLLATSQNVVMALVPGNLVVSIILGISLKKVWSAINALQFLIYFKLWQVSIPANTEKFVNYVQFIARGEFIPKDKIMNKLMALLHIAKSDDKAKNFTRFLIVILVGISVIAAVVSLLVYLCRKQESRLTKALIGIKDQIFWNIILRTAIQMYLDLCISAMVAISAGFNQPFQIVAINLGIIVVLTLIPFIFLKIILKNFERLSSPEVVKKFGTLYQGVDIRNTCNAFYTIVFLSRRFLFAVYTAFVAKRCNSIAIVMVSYLNIAVQFYTVHAFPLDTKNANLIEIASEVLLHYTFLSFVFIQLQFNPISEYNAGWITVATVLTLVLINLTNMLYDVVAKLVTKLRQKYLAYKRKRWPRPMKPDELECKEQLEMLERFDSDIERVTKARASKIASYDRSVAQIQLKNESFEEGTDEDIHDELPKAGHIIIKESNLQTIESLKSHEEQLAAEEPVFVDTWDDDTPAVLQDCKVSHHQRSHSNDLLLPPSFDDQNVFNIDVFYRPHEQSTEINGAPDTSNDQEIEIQSIQKNDIEESKTIPSDDESNQQEFDKNLQEREDVIAETPTLLFQRTPTLGTAQVFLDLIEPRPNQLKQMPKTDSNWGLQTLAAIKFGRSKKR